MQTEAVVDPPETANEVMLPDPPMKTKPVEPSTKITFNIGGGGAASNAVKSKKDMTGQVGEVPKVQIQAPPIIEKSQVKLDTTLA